MLPYPPPHTVVAGGFLEVRYLRLEQGKGRTIERPGLRPLDLRLGTVALVELGGRFTAFGYVVSWFTPWQSSTMQQT